MSDPKKASLKKESEGADGASTPNVDGAAGSEGSSAAEPAKDTPAEQGDLGNSEDSKVIDLDAAGKAAPEAADTELPEPELFEMGEPDMVKPIYALGKPGQPFIEKVQGIQLAGGVLVRWNNTANFFYGARLEAREDGAYMLRGA